MHTDNERLSWRSIEYLNKKRKLWLYCCMSLIRDIDSSCLARMDNSAIRRVFSARSGKEQNFACNNENVRMRACVRACVRVCVFSSLFEASLTHVTKFQTHQFEDPYSICNEKKNKGHEKFTTAERAAMVVKCATLQWRQFHQKHFNRVRDILVVQQEFVCWCWRDCIKCLSWSKPAETTVLI